MQIDNQSINELLDQRLLQWHAMQDKRKYLGASMIGDECIRKVQLQYLGKDPTVTAKQVRTFDIGHHLEDLVIHWLRIAGFYVITRDDNDEQYRKIAGHVDEIIQAFPKELLDATSRCPAGRANNECSVTLLCDLYEEIVEKIVQLIKTPEIALQLSQVASENNDQNVTNATIISAINDLSEIWEYLYTAEQRKIARLLINGDIAHPPPRIQQNQNK